MIPALAMVTYLPTLVKSIPPLPFTFFVCSALPASLPTGDYQPIDRYNPKAFGIVDLFDKHPYHSNTTGENGDALPVYCLITP